MSYLSKFNKLNVLRKILQNNKNYLARFCTKKSDNNLLWTILNDRMIYNENLMIYNTSISSKFIFKEHPIFNCETLILDNCDEDFIYYHLNNTTFPLLETLYLKTKINKEVLLDLHKQYDLYVHENHYRLTDSDKDLINIISNNKYEEFVNSFEYEKLDFD